jgi:hypothetical protein
MHLQSEAGHVCVFLSTFTPDFCSVKEYTFARGRGVPRAGYHR